MALIILINCFFLDFMFDPAGVIWKTRWWFL